MAGRSGNMLNPSVDVATEAAVGTDPYAAALARCDGPSQIALQAFGFAGGSEFSNPQPQQSDTVAPDPHAALVVLQQRAQIARGEQIAGQRAEHPIVPTHQPAVACGDPQIAVVVAQQRAHQRAQAPGRGNGFEAIAG